MHAVIRASVSLALSVSPRGRCIAIGTCLHDMHLMQRAVYGSCITVTPKCAERAIATMTSAGPTGTDDHGLVSVGEVRSFVQRCMVAAGAAEKHAESLAAVLVAADERGHFSHGLNRLGMYVMEVREGNCDGHATPSVVRETPATAFVDGKNGIGTVVSTYCMEIAIKKAKEVGVGWVTCKDSNHFGIAGFYSLLAIKEGLIGMAFTNTSPLVVPTRAKKSVLGTNAMAFATPAKSGDSFVLDMATSTVSIGKVEMEQRKGLSIPIGWGVDKDGMPTTNPGDVIDGSTGGLCPLGGGERTGGYKGYGLSMMVEALCGVMTGGPYAHHIRKWTADKSPAHVSHSFIAMDPTVFNPDYKQRMGDFMGEMRSLDPVDPDKPVLVAGDPEREHVAEVEKDGGIWYHRNVISAMNTLAKELKVEEILELQKQ